ncbi:MAG TPA: hypothetical protein VIY86_02160 [Pirellulaceae bacterium]
MTRLPLEDPEQLQLRMLVMRSQIGEDLEEVVGRAKAWTDWRNVVRSRPLLSIAAGVAMGYLAIPRRDGGFTANRNHTEAGIATFGDASRGQQATHSSTTLDRLAAIAAGAVAKSALTLLAQYLSEKWFSRREPKLRSSSKAHATR